MKSKIVLWNILSNVIYQITTIISGLVIPILIIKYYGSEINGLNASINQAIGYLHLVEAGIGMASIQALYKPLSSKNSEEINGVLSATKNLYNKSGLFFLILLLTLMVVYPLIIQDGISKSITIGLVLVLGLGGIVEYFLHGKYRVLLLADQKGYVIFNLQSLASVLSTLLKVYLIQENYSIIFVQAIATSMFLLRVLLLKIYIQKNYSNINYNGEPNNNALNKKNAVFVHQIAFLVLNNTDILIISIFLSLKTVSVYSIYNIVFTAIGGLIISLSSSSLSAAFGQILALGDKRKIKSGYNVYEFIYFIILFAVYNVAFIMTLPFIELYTMGVKDANYIDRHLPLLFSFIGLLNHIRNPMVAIINGAGHFKETQNKAIIEAVINLGVSLLLVRSLGVYGVLIGTIVAFIYRTADTLFYTHKHILDQSPILTLKRLGLNFIGCLVIIYIVVKFKLIHAITWIQWIESSLSMIFLTLIILIIFNWIHEPSNLKKVFRHIKHFNH
ncbi:polysaccharide biosynthesis C-terminal domain-containing protein [Rossellomorea marisflavi]|uniref:lipopolysaccharide biosynthesis protein n=1 Tax=Rossellomorea marisflavi TaxID=189381 RepID=UPI0027A3B328|nr:polysaccharide biosynthesis C-terminal domain-containing protein [Rossellomorea marisflavi]UTE73412.1 polysaccharide biosynthesis C-terminal domain-containing protein [Rossellomorea marisflavi]